LRPETRLVAGGRPPHVAGGPVSPGIELTSTYHEGGPVTYGRESNETWRAFEEVVGELEGGTAVAFASGTAATAAVLESLPVGGRVLMPPDAYHGTRRFLAERSPRLLPAASIEEADLVWIETPSNPMMAVTDIGAVVAGARGVPVVVDNTLATPLFQQPLSLGADVVVHSATKQLAGHSDVLLGVAVARSEEWVERLRERRSRHGAIPGPFEAWLALRGLRTLSVRLERASESAAVLAARLREHPQVERVRYPGWGFGLSFDVAGGAAAADRVAAGLRLVVSATSLGGVETLIERRNKWVGEEHVPPGLLRLSVGLEHVEDLWADLSQALG
jgi:cystathionine gamma-synthase